MKKRVVGITRFLGTNCDQDIWKAVEQSQCQPKWMWFNDRFDVNDVDAVVVPGGFSHGDYLRAGALAARTPVMDSVREAASRGIPILGICNGFQILCESGLLPGALIGNVGRRFVDGWVELRVEAPNSHWGVRLKKGDVVRLPIAHGQGCFFASDSDLKQIEDNHQVWLRYQKNPNGSLADIAGIANRTGNVVGLMPHPERAMRDWMGSLDGISFFQDAQ